MKLFNSRQAAFAYLQSLGWVYMRQNEERQYVFMWPATSGFRAVQPHGSKWAVKIL